MKSKHSLIAGLVAGIGASLCCVGPLLLLTLGVGGAWIANLSVLRPWSPLFSLVALAFLALAWRGLYRASDCAPGAACAAEAGLKRQRVAFWIIAPPLVALLAFPYYARIFY